MTDPAALQKTDSDRHADSNKYRALSVPNAALVRQVETARRFCSCTASAERHGRGGRGSKRNRLDEVESLGADFACFGWEARGHGSARRVADAGLADYYEDAREALAAEVNERLRRFLGEQIET